MSECKANSTEVLWGIVTEMPSRSMVESLLELSSCLSEPVSNGSSKVGWPPCC
jgi:hypothetical protein